MIKYKPSAADEPSVQLVFVEADNLVFDRWKSYQFSDDFLTPTDHFNFEIGVDDLGLPDKQRDALKFGALIQLRMDNVVLATGRIDKIEIATDRGGSRYTIHGRDLLGQTLDAVADPTIQFKEGATLAEFLKRLFKDFGWPNDDDFVIDATGNRNVRSGLRGTPMTRPSTSSRTKRGRARKTKRSGGGGPKPLKSFVLHQTKPYNHESIFHFASRVTQRHGLWIWLTADGENIIVSKPDFEQEPTFELIRSRDGTSNVISGTVTLDMTDQPSILIADGWSGGGEFGKSKVKAYCVGPLLGFDEDKNPIKEITTLLEKHPGAIEVKMQTPSFFLSTGKVPFRPMFLTDQESKTPAQLENFVRREISLLTRKAITAHYVVQGHGQIVDDRFVAWAPDTVVHVRDDAAGMDQPMYVQGVHYHKSVGSSGTTTMLDLIQLNTLVF